MTRNDKIGFLVAGLLTVIVIVGGLVKVGVERAEMDMVFAKFPDRGVSRINIALDGVSLEEINAGSKEVKYDRNELDLYDGDSVQKFNDVQVKGRGNGTWVQEKKPYQIKFSEKVDLLGMGKAKKWVLLANAMDATNLRTAAAFYLEEMLDMKFRFQGEFVELYVNDRYEGLYYLTHAVEIGKNVVDLRDPMGVLVELDNLYYGTEDYYKSENGDYLVVKDVVNEANKEKAMRGFLEVYNEFEEVVAEKNFEKIKELADVESFAQYYLLSEFSVNPDAYWTSFYMYKDGLNDKIHAGPGWDFDLAFANRWWGNWMGEKFYSSEETMMRKGEILTKEEYDEMGLESEIDWYEWSQKLSKIMFDLMELPEFRDEVDKQYREKMQDSTKEMITSMKEWANSIDEPMWKDHEKWDRGDYKKDIEEMIEWIKKRSDFFEKEYGVYKTGI